MVMTFCCYFGKSKRDFRRKSKQHGDHSSSMQAQVLEGNSSSQRHMDSSVFCSTAMLVGEEPKPIITTTPAQREEEEDDDDDEEEEDDDEEEEEDDDDEEEEEEEQLWVRLEDPHPHPPYEKNEVASSVSIPDLKVDEVEEGDHIHNLFIEKPEKPSPVSILDLPFLDQPLSKSTSTGDEQSFEEVALVRITCMGDEEFKRVYIRTLLDLIFNKCRISEDEEVLSESLYDEVIDANIVGGEIPDDLKLLFDCVNEVLTEYMIHRRRLFEGVCWYANGTAMFPSMEKENLVEHVLKRTNFDRELPATLCQIVKRDLDVGSMHWKRTALISREGIEDAGIDVGDEMFEQILEETVLDLGVGDMKPT